MRIYLSLPLLLLGACALFAVPRDLQCDAEDFPTCDPDKASGRLVCVGGIILREDCPVGICDSVTNQCNTSCGNGTLDVGEDCDDGNNVDSDTCEADCT